MARQSDVEFVEYFLFSYRSPIFVNRTVCFMSFLKRKRVGRDIFYRGTKGGIRSIKNPVYKVTLYELLRAYSLVKTQSIFQKIDIPKLPVMTTQEGIKQIKDNMQLIDDWKKIHELIPESFNKTLKSK